MFNHRLCDLALPGIRTKLLMQRRNVAELSAAGVAQTILTIDLHTRVYIAHDLSWNYHCEHIVKRARKRLYALRVLIKSLSSQEVLKVYCSLCLGICIPCLAWLTRLP